MFRCCKKKKKTKGEKLIKKYPYIASHLQDAKFRRYILDNINLIDDLTYVSGCC